jgi:hypothetical protein
MGVKTVPRQASVQRRTFANGAATVALHLASWLRSVIDPAASPIASGPARRRTHADA